MAEHKDEIENSFDGTIVWERLENKRASRIKHEMTPTELKNLQGRFNDEVYWEELIAWYKEAMVKFYAAMYPVWEKVQKEIS